MNAPFTPEEALESARAHATKAAQLWSEADESGADGLMRLADAHERTGLTMRAYAEIVTKLAAAEKRAEEVERINREHAECTGELEYAQENAMLTSQLASAQGEIERLKRRVLTHWTHANVVCDSLIQSSSRRMIEQCFAAAPKESEG